MQRITQLIRKQADPNAQHRRRRKHRDRTRPRADAPLAAAATRVADYPRFYSPLDDLSDVPWTDFHSQLARPRHVSSGVSPHLRYIPYEAPTKVRVKRGEYQSLVDFIEDNQRFGTVVGPTACGKSSYALLPLLQAGKSILLVQPSPTNVASCMANFAHRIPAAIETRNLPFSRPNVAHCGFLSIVDSPAQLNICESKDLEAFFDRHGTYPPVDVILLDEYHLPRSEHVRIRIILTHVSTIYRPPTVIFASATPPDEEPTAGSDFGKHKQYGNMFLLIIADSCPAAHTLVERLRSLGERVAPLCPCVSRETATEWLRRETHDVTFVATPDTEAGLDTSCSHMVNPGTAVRTIFENGVLYSSVFRLGPRQNVQRLGRAGRSRHTIVYTSPGTGGSGLDSCSPVDAATAAMKMLKVTGKLPDSPDCKAALEEFPRLAKVSRRAVEKALRAKTPVLELYRRNKDGDTFKEFGGKADGFVEECGADLRLFTWKGGRAFSPSLDLTAYHNPTEGQTTESLKSLAEAALSDRQHLVAKLGIYKAFDSADQEPEAFSQAIWLALKESGARATCWSRMTAATSHPSQTARQATCLGILEIAPGVS
ncbi:P-loop containing nucleoside triphosphate hydrolase protein [Achaetomium macrosporum]|uniref:P-loop containing nucleoside triphosphate hydrolase protein n=1 Tax=Achaetomium macrosporum TaxID=79813 RepID=A0AAN7C0N2_9PEZI|nr:P-loop containing nucleoside triphosphate hydrolase protein [Achaetomium macrosporum]